jgi:peptide/nickel transport system permease protein
MTQYLIRRVLQAILVVWGVSTIVFAMSHLTGDPGALLLPANANAQQLAQFKSDMGLDQPLYVQYLKFLGQLARGDLGVSIQRKELVADLVLERLPQTLKLSGTAFLISTIIAFPGRDLWRDPPRLSW